ncbi:MAG: helix-turn-helix transcriptional regulator [Aldersonia sp.]|nr:helix-turn-helix transcriptional regulator [Aldersonia sp.]
MSSFADLLRPRDSDALRAELRGLAAETGVPVLFGGEVHDRDVLLLSEFYGTRTSSLRGLVIAPESGLGGQAVVGRRPVSVADYARARSITHDYDGPVIGEGIRSVLAVPVVVAGRARAVLYGAARGVGPLGDRTAELMIRAGRRLSDEFAIRDEVDRRLRLRQAVSAAPAQDTATTEELRAVYAELRGIAAGLTDADAKQRLHAVSRQLARLASPTSQLDSPEEPVRLSRRELDVLAQIGLGCSNIEAAKRLGVGPETVKSYLRAAMGKLGAHSRHAAVVRARRLGLLP